MKPPSPPRILHKGLHWLFVSMLIAACNPSGPSTALQPTQPAIPVTPKGPEPTQVPEATATIPPAPMHPAAGLTFSTAEGLWLIDPQGAPKLLVDQGRASLSPDGRLVVYQSEDPETALADIWLLDLVSGEQRNLTNTPDRNEDEPAWWGGRTDVVFFVSDVEIGMASASYPTVVGLDGTGYTVIDSEVGGPHALSPDGISIAYGGYDGKARIYCWREGSEVFDPSAYGVSVSNLLQPSWSPDGRYLGWKVAGDLRGDGSSALGVAVFDLEAKTARVYHIYEVAAGGGFPQDLIWSPDGQWLAFTAFGEDPSAGRAPNLWVMRPDGSQETKVAIGLDPVWSPDGRRLAYLRTNDEGGQELWLADTGTWATQRLDLTLSSQILFLMEWVRP